MAEYRTEAIRYVELAPGQVVVGKGGDLGMVLAAGWQFESEFPTERGKFKLSLQLGHSIVDRFVDVARWPTANVLVPAEIAEAAALAVIAS